VRKNKMRRLSILAVFFAGSRDACPDQFLIYHNGAIIPGDSGGWTIKRVEMTTEEVPPAI